MSLAQALILLFHKQVWETDGHGRQYATDRYLHMTLCSWVPVIVRQVIDGTNPRS